ncbi:unnamed protein product [Symbiodinium natans]|uniref:Uncharacterized protein n=1 Tax=Symbiodinium natans TaxID=878477 RepID=A0A812LUT8_9DINO|nr:unnamed protein product [Symbiodinium natans]
MASSSTSTLEEQYEELGKKFDALSLVVANGFVNDGLPTDDAQLEAFAVKHMCLAIEARKKLCFSKVDNGTEEYAFFVKYNGRFYEVYGKGTWTLKQLKDHILAFICPEYGHFSLTPPIVFNPAVVENNRKKVKTLFPNKKVEVSVGGAV